MNCDEARSSLFDWVEDERRIPAVERDALRAHVEGCPSCTADVAAIHAMRRRAEAWRDEPMPRWHRPRVERPAWRDWRVWFPVAASTTAFALAAVAVVTPWTTGGPDEAPAPTVAGYDPVLQRQLVDAAVERFRDEFESRREIDRTLLLQAAMEAARSQREEELTTLAAFLKAEMDRRSLETDESLRYLITDQARDRRRLEDLFQRVGTRREPPESRR